jgi:hypothetical protein
MRRIRVRPDFADTIVRAELTRTGFAKRAGVNHATLYALINPIQHPSGAGAGCGSSQRSTLPQLILRRKRRSRGCWSRKRLEGWPHERTRWRLEQMRRRK